MRNYEYRIYKLYKVFYDKEPNLCKDNLINITIEVQSMLYFLREHGIIIGCETGLALGYYKDLDLPMDMGIQDIIVQEMIEKDVSSLDDSVPLTELTTRYVNIVGSRIRELMEKSENPIEDLRKSTYILYSREFCYPSASDEKIIEYMNCTKEELGIARSLTRLKQEID